MERLRAVVLLLALLVALAGCADDDAGDGGDGGLDDGDGTDGGDTTDGGDGGDGGGGNGTDDANATQEVPDPKGLEGKATGPDPTVDSMGCKGALGGSVSGSDHPAVVDYVGWHYVLTPSFFQLEFEDADGVEEAEDEGIVPDGTINVHVCTSSTNAQDTTYLLCLTHPDYEGDRATACDEA